MLEVLFIVELPSLIIPPKDPTLDTTDIVVSPTSIIVPDGDKSFSTDEPEDTDETDPAEPDPSDEDFVDTAVEKEDFPSDETKDVVAPLLKRKAEEENYDESEVMALVDLTRKMLPVTSGPVPREIASKVINAIDIDDIEFHQAAIDGKLRYQKQPIYRKLNQMQRAAIDNFLRILFKNRHLL